MLNTTDTSVDFTKDLALALFTSPDTTASLTLARRLGTPPLSYTLSYPLTR